MTLWLPIDHLVALTPDLEAAGAAFRAAGFLTTPITRHSPAMGTANVCVMFRETYLELMGIVAETEANAGWRALLAEGPGLRGVALRSDDIEATARDLDRRGIAREPVRDFARVTPEGELRFSVIRIARAATPGLQCLACRHHTRDLLWRPELVEHPNGARDLLAASLPAAASLAALAGPEAPGATPISSGPASLTFHFSHSPEPDALEAIRRLAGLETISR